MIPALDNYMPWARSGGTGSSFGSDTAGDAGPGPGLAVGVSHSESEPGLGSDKDVLTNRCSMPDIADCSKGIGHGS